MCVTLCHCDMLNWFKFMWEVMGSNCIKVYMSHEVTCCGGHVRVTSDLVEHALKRITDSDIACRGYSVDTRCSRYSPAKKNLQPSVVPKPPKNGG